MTTITDQQPTLLERPKRADARRNYDKVLAAAREAFLEGGESTSLEEVARRAGVGIGTLYRHFPTRQALLEALYAGEVEELARSAARLDGEDPWHALTLWLENFIAYLATKRALHEELMKYMDRDAPLFTACKGSMWAAGEPLLKHAQDAGVVRTDIDFGDVIHMVMAIGKIPTDDRTQIDRLLGVALDGLRSRPQH
jgi:AcrR family transcriptional regulator